MSINFLNSTDFQDNYTPQNWWSTSLAADITDTDTSITLADAPPSSKGWITIDSEHIFYDTVNGSVISISTGLAADMRGQDDSTAATHSTGAIVEQRINAAAVKNIMDSVKKRKEYNFNLSEVAANSSSDIDITSFASRAWIHDLRVYATGGSNQFKIELFYRDTFRMADRVYESEDLNSVETVLDQDVTSGTSIVYVASTDGFLVDSLISINGGSEFALVKDIAAGDYLEAYDSLESSFVTGDSVVMCHRDQKSFYYEDHDWTAEMHIRVTNYDMVSPVTVNLYIIAEVSDDA